MVIMEYGVNVGEDSFMGFSLFTMLWSIVHYENQGLDPTPREL